MRFELTTKPSTNDAKAISDGIIDFNRHTVGLEPYEDEIKFSIFVKDNDKVVGGLRAICYWNTLHIELLWLDQSCRGQGVGEKVIKQAEQFAKENGYEKSFVETTSWQAKPFYEKMNYQLQYSIKDRPKGHDSFYLIKEL